jgi:hypothetical protein
VRWCSEHRTSPNIEQPRLLPIEVRAPPFKVLAKSLGGPIAALSGCWGDGLLKDDLFERWVRLAADRSQFETRILTCPRLTARQVLISTTFVFAEPADTQLEPHFVCASHPLGPRFRSRIRRLVATWQQEHERWQGRDLSTRRYLYVWADGVYFAPRLDHDRQCILVLIGADPAGKKELLAIEDGYRESTQSWRELLLRLRDDNGLATSGARVCWSAIKRPTLCVIQYAPLRHV